MEQAAKVLKRLPSQKQLQWTELDAASPEDLYFLARQLVQCTLPHRDPGDVPLWTRTNGDLTLVVSRTAIDERSGKPIGYPFGSIPRLLLYWINSEAVRTKNPRLHLGNSLSAFLRELGLSPETGRGKRGDAFRLREQMRRLFSAAVRFQYTQLDDGRSRQKLMPVVSDSELWWSPRDPKQDDLWFSWVELGRDFFDAITQSAVPLDTRVIREIKRSPLALDLYAWLSYTSYSVTRKKTIREVSWDQLHGQMGTHYSNIHEFRRYALRSLRKIISIDPRFRIEPVDGRLRINPASTLLT